MPITKELLTQQFKQNQTKLDVSHHTLDANDVKELLDFVNKNPSVTELDLAYCKINDEDAVKLVQLPLLRKINFEISSISDIVAIAISNSTSLEWVDLSACPITDNGAYALSNNKSLTHLEISGCSKITEKGVAALSLMENIDKLILDDMFHLDDDKLESLNKQTHSERYLTAKDMGAKLPMKSLTKLCLFAINNNKPLQQKANNLFTDRVYGFGKMLDETSSQACKIDF